MKKHSKTSMIALILCLSLIAGGALAEMPVVQPVGTARTGRLMITEPGDYTLTGSMRGSVFVDPGAGEVNLYLDNVTIDGNGEPAIIAQSGDKVNVVTMSGTVNHLSGSADSYGIQSAAPLNFGGQGQLSVTGGSPIQADQGYTIQSGSVLALGQTAVQLPVNQGAQPSVVMGMDSMIPADAKVSLVGQNGQTTLSFSAGMPFSTFLYSNPALTAGLYQLFANGSFVGSVGDPTQSYTFRAQSAPQLPVSSEAPQANENTGVPQLPDDNAAPQLPDNSNVPQLPDDSNAPQLPDNSNAPQLPDDSNAPQLPDDSNAPQLPDNSNAPQLPDDTNAPQLPDDSNAPQLPDDTNAPQLPDNSNAPQMPGQQNTPFPGPQENASSASSASEIVTSTVVNSAASLTADMENATYITVTDEDSQVKITSSGTYVISGSSSDGNITVKKATTGVVLVLEDLDLTSTTGATLSINKEAEVKIIISGNVTLTDNENPDDENSTDEEIADAFDGAAIKAKANSSVYLTGDGRLTINGNAKNGIKAGDDAAFTIDGDLEIDITAANDGINTNHDLTILNGHITIAAGDDAIHSDRILTIGSADGTGPDITVTSCYEGLEGTIVNIFGGNISIRSSDDAINAANGDGTYEGELAYAFNMTGGTVVINSDADGVDSNGDINLIGGNLQISSVYNGGDAGIDYDGQLYIADAFGLNNNSGVAGPDNMMGGMMNANGQNMMPGSQDMNGQNGFDPFGANAQTGSGAPSFGGQNTASASFDPFGGNSAGQMSASTQPMGGQPGSFSPMTGNTQSASGQLPAMNGFAAPSEEVNE